MPVVAESIVDTISITYTENGLATPAQIGTYTAREVAEVVIIVPATTTNQEIDIAFPFATVQSTRITSSEDLDLYVNDASTGTPAAHLVVKKALGIYWGVGFSAANPWTVNVTKFYATNAGAVDARLRVRVIYNALP